MDERDKNCASLSSQTRTNVNVQKVASSAAMIKENLKAYNLLLDSSSI